MPSVDLTVFVDEFGDDILANPPSSPFGVGCFICRNEDIDVLNKKLAKCIPQTIHLRKCVPIEDLCNMTKKVASFLDNCDKDIHAGGVIFSKPELFKQAEESGKEFLKEYGENGEKLSMRNWGLHGTIGQIPKIVSIDLALKYIDFQTIKIKFIFEETGNHKDFKKRTEEIHEVVSEGIKILLKDIESYPQLGKRLRRPEIEFCKSQDNIKLAQLADVFAHVTKKIYHSENKFSKKLHNLLKNHFNLFDFSFHEQIHEGIFDLHHDFKIKGNVLILSPCFH